MKKVLIIGANGTLGSAISTHFSNSTLSAQYQVITLTQQDTDYSEESLQTCTESLKKVAPFAMIICCVGVLHSEVVQPEKRLEQLSADVLSEYFRVNTIIPVMCIRFFHKLLDKQSPSSFVLLSAMVGSISDNRLGGWYGYRSSKAALNMLIKTASIEVARTNKQACLAAVHPGTTQSPLSKPFSERVASDKYYTPAQSAQRIVELAERLTPEQSGSFFNWDGSLLGW